jgi:transketolase
MTKRDPRQAFNEELERLGSLNHEIVAVSCDSAKGAGMSGFHATQGDKLVEVGISEQTAVSLCYGLAESGWIPVISAITPFLTMRAYEQIRNDIGYTKANVKVVGSGAGLAYATLGSSHEAIEDVAVMRSIPNMVILAPADAEDVKLALRLSVDYKGPVYIRMARQAMTDLPKSIPRAKSIGELVPLKGGRDMLVLTYGTMVSRVLEAVNSTELENDSIGVASAFSVKPLDGEALKEMCKGYKIVVTVEEHVVSGGLGTAVCEALEESAVPVRRLGIQEGVKRVGPYEEILEAYGLSAAALVTSFKEILAVLPA